MMPIHSYAITGDVKGLRAELDAGVDPNRKTDNVYQDTPLIYAICYLQSNCVKLLLERKADPNLKDGQGMAPLALSPRTDIADLLISHGACVTESILLAKTRYHYLQSDITTMLKHASADAIKAVIKLIPHNVLNNPNFMSLLKEDKWRDLNDRDWDQTE